MDENRFQAYLTLIEKLLICPGGQELELLQANKELVDSDFTQVVQQVASEMTLQEAYQEANFLTNLSEPLKHGLVPMDMRSYAYIQLIDSLLSCPSGKELQILQENQELIDTGFVHSMTEAAKVLAEKGDKDAAEWLQDFAAKLLKLLE
jgi:hypothetical protein